MELLQKDLSLSLNVLYVQLGLGNNLFKAISGSVMLDYVTM